MKWDRQYRMRVAALAGGAVSAAQPIRFQVPGTVVGVSTSTDNGTVAEKAGMDFQLTNEKAEPFFVDGEVAQTTTLENLHPLGTAPTPYNKQVEINTRWAGVFTNRTANPITATVTFFVEEHRTAVRTG